jgi:hypothetical protein
VSESGWRIQALLPAGLDVSDQTYETVVVPHAATLASASVTLAVRDTGVASMTDAGPEIAVICGRLLHAGADAALDELEGEEHPTAAARTRPASQPVRNAMAVLLSGALRLPRRRPLPASVTRTPRPGI